MTRRIIARLIAALVLGLVVGYAVGKNMARDVARGKTLTMKEYIADFDNHRKELVKSDLPMGFAVFIGALLVMLVFGLYELLVIGVDRVLGVLDRRRGVAVQPGTPPPW